MDVHIHRQDNGAGRRRELLLPDHSQGMEIHGYSALGADVRASLIAGSALQAASGAHEPPRLKIVVLYSLIFTILRITISVLIKIPRNRAYQNPVLRRLLFENWWRQCFIVSGLVVIVELDIGL